jgi:NAD(P)-dependent dehydrogenase (short-subunit alcohol dehydrogenase family)
MGRLDGKVALIGGTARGMGRAAALEFAAQGAAVFGCDLDEKASAETVEMVTAAGGRMAALAPVDLASAEGARTWAGAAVAEFGGVNQERAGHRLVLRPCRVARAGGAGGGSIINVASIAARFGARFAGQVPHGSAKGGVLAMTKHLCAAGGALGIRANAILPGLIYTPETARFIDDPDGPLPSILAKIPLGRYGHAAEVARLAAFLASDDVAFITGAEIAIDGGDGSVAA